MIRNLKVLGIALAAVFAMSAVASSVASAAPALFTAALPAGPHSGNTQIVGEQVGTDIFTITGLPALTCSTVTYTGEFDPGDTSATYATIIPEYGTCHIVAPIIGTRTATVTMNGCDYTFNATKNTNSTGTPGHAGAPTPTVLTEFSADLTVKCPAGKSIQIHVYNTSNHNDAGAGVLCTYDIHHQTIDNQIELTNILTPLPDDILAHIHAKVAVTNTTVGGICGGAANTTAIYKGTATLRATNAAKQFVNTTVS